jgi:uncharacterized protein YecE (DUF72 family)
MNMNAGRSYIGTSGYVYAHWKEIFYPADMPGRDWFEYYAQKFSTVELNNSFYRLPSAEAFVAWRRRAPTDFLFAVKFSRYGSHLMRLKNGRDTIQRFVANARHLKRHLGPVLVQLPPNWKVNVQRLEQFLACIPKRQRWTIEFRDRRWLCKEVYRLLRRHQVALCIHDKIIDHPREITTDWTYLRFHGAPQDGGNYSAARLQAYAREINGWLGSGLDVYGYFNNDGHGYAIANALTLKNLLSKDSTDATTTLRRSA